MENKRFSLKLWFQGKAIMSTSMIFPNHSKALLEQVLTSLEDLNRKDINKFLSVKMMPKFICKGGKLS